jgi:hypothetical protein
MPYKDLKLQQEANKRWFEKNREKVREYQREYQRRKRSENPEPHREASRKWQQNLTPEERRVRWKHYYHSNLERNRKKSRENAKRYFDALREEVLNAYGNMCKCCGETEKVFLSIDHINGGGNAHRKAVGGSSHQIYLWLKRFNFPQNDFRCLCMNCQIGYARNGICPHQIKKEKLE